MSEMTASILGTSLYALAAAAVLWGFLGQRIIVRVKRLRRCPKCLYDMSGTESMTCSECGRVAKRERSLHRGRTRKRWVLLALLVLPGAHVTGRIPQIEDRGWVAAVPTTVLILSLPWLEPDLDWVEAKYRVSTPVSFIASWSGDARRQFMNWAMQAGNAAPLPEPTWRERSYEELLDRRLGSTTLWSWQESVLGLVCDAQSREDNPQQWKWDSLRDHVIGTTRWADDRELPWVATGSVQGASMRITTRERWPADTPVFGQIQVLGADGQARVQLRSLTPGLRTLDAEIPGPGRPRPITQGNYQYHVWTDGAECLGSAPEGTKELRYAVTWMESDAAISLLPVRRWRAVKREMIRTPIEIVSSVDRILTPVQSEELESLLENKYVSVGKYAINTSELKCSGHGLRGLQPTLVLDPDLTFAFRAEIVRGQQIIGTAHGWYSSSAPTLGWLLELHDIDLAELEDDDASSPLQLHIVSDPIMALRDLNHSRYWDGEVTIPLKWAESGMGYVVKQDSLWNWSEADQSSFAIPRSE